MLCSDRHSRASYFSLTLFLSFARVFFFYFALTILLALLLSARCAWPRSSPHQSPNATTHLFNFSLSLVHALSHPILTLSHNYRLIVYSQARARTRRSFFLHVCVSVFFDFGFFSSSFACFFVFLY